MSHRLHGYALMLGCTSCGLKKRVPYFPTAGAYALGEILTERHVASYKTGCLRCGTHRFEVLTVPPQEPVSGGPVGWSP
jgi:hypothetical protein